MRLQPNRDYISDDVVQTPAPLARRLVEHFKPRGRILEPCKGTGNFYRALRAHTQSAAAVLSVDWCEVKQGRDFFEWQDKVDWIVTNPPWSQIRAFLQHAMRVSDNIVFLLTINHVWTKARVRDVRDAGFGIREIVLVDMPPAFPQSGFQLGAVHFRRGSQTRIALTNLGRCCSR
ncbi:MAG TPA: hypothetical protein VHD62_16770 [Opitutaceae bacterium]|nr:hypothetical protein [Opitutaceae bacterium]